MRNTIRIDGEKLVKLVEETPKEELEKLFAKAIHENMYELCMDNLKERDRDLKLTGKCKKCYDYLAEQFIRNYIDGKSMFDVMDDTMSDRFYNTWLVFLGIVRRIVKEGRKFHGIENIISASGIPRKTWVIFIDAIPKR